MHVINPAIGAVVGDVLHRIEATFALPLRFVVTPGDVSFSQDAVTEVVIGDDRAMIVAGGQRYTVCNILS